MKKIIMLVFCLIPLICFAPYVSDKQKTTEVKQNIKNLELMKYLTFRLGGDLDSNFPIYSPIKSDDIYRISDLYGWRRIHPISKKSGFHYGIDFSAYSGTNIYSTATGTVIDTGWEPGYGKQITIDHKNGYITKYAHLSKINVNLNDSVYYGKVIGLTGNTGISTGPHLHYEILKNGRPIDPMKMLIDKPSKKNLDLYLSLLAKTDKIAWLQVERR